MNTKKLLLLLIIVLAVWAGVYFYVSQRQQQPATGITPSQWDGTWRTFHDDTFRFSLSYPSNFKVVESVVMDRENQLVRSIGFGEFVGMAEDDPGKPGFNVSVLATDENSVEGWFDHKKESTKFSTLVLDKKINAGVHVGLLYHEVELGVDPNIFYDQSAVFFKDGNIFVIYGLSEQIKPIVASFKFD